MARTTPAGESWSAWLIPKLVARGWRDPGPNPIRTGAAPLVAAVNDIGVDLARQTVSKWLKGENAADPNMAGAVASALDADPLEALSEAGYAPIARHIASLMEGRPARPAGVRPDPVAERIQEILGDNRLTPVEQKDALAHLDRRVKSVLAEVNGIVDAILASRDEAESA
jgi:hypothetical protein